MPPATPRRLRQSAQGPSCHPDHKRQRHMINAIHKPPATGCGPDGIGRSGSFIASTWRSHQSVCRLTHSRKRQGTAKQHAKDHQNPIGLGAQLPGGDGRRTDTPTSAREPCLIGLMSQRDCRRSGRVPGGKGNWNLHSVRSKLPLHCNK